MEFVKMNPEVKEKWVNALEEGNWKQARGRLKDDSSAPGEEGCCYCCLGVLCELGVIEGVGKGFERKLVQDKVNGPWQFRVERDDLKEGEIDGSEWFPPTVIREWAGLSTSDPTVKFDISYLNEEDRQGLEYSLGVPADMEGTGVININLSKLNDGIRKDDTSEWLVKRHTFKEIAEIIREQL